MKRCFFSGISVIVYLYLAAATVDFILSGLALSGSVVLGNRNFYRCGMGQRVLGKLLGLGPERSLGSDYFHALWNGFSCAKYPSFQKSVLFSLVFNRFVLCHTDDLFRRKLCTRRNAQLCRISDSFLLST